MPSVTALTSHSRRLPLLSHHGAFRLHASVLVGLLAASSAPTPLYALYQAAWHFSAMTLTGVFSAYALALLVALLTASTLSDHLGRRPVLAAALLAEVLAMAVFATAQGVPALIAARILQGLATGAATSAAGAALLDFENPGRPGRAAAANGITPVAGMAAGVLAATTLAQYAPTATRTVYLLLLLLFTAQAAAVLLTPETAGPHPGAWRSLRPAVTVAPASRPAIPGALLTLSGPHLHSLLALFAGTALAGAGFGAVTQAALRLLLPPAAPGERAGTLAAYYVLSYLAMGIPAVLAGLLTNLYGLQTAVSLYAVTVILLTLIGLIRAVRQPHAV
ncbi:MFS transporter [Kitasatospora sp. NPDC085895]|uniref:MFS transporter n=1 Tax=Kitasatospora sp. NPDC085895 TaxID=3155057 RepID=UPI003450DEE1